MAPRRAGVALGFLLAGWAGQAHATEGALNGLGDLVMLALAVAGVLWFGSLLLLVARGSLVVWFFGTALGLPPALVAAWLAKAFGPGVAVFMVLVAAGPGLAHQAKGLLALTARPESTPDPR